jgi:transposase
MHRHELTDKEWERIRPLLPPAHGRHSLKGERRFISGVLWLTRTGAPWRDLPRRYGNWKSVYNRFNNWSKRGIWERLFKELQIEPDAEGSILDGSIVRAHQDAAGGKGGSDAMLWDALEGVLRRKFMPLSTPEDDQDTSS